MIRSSENVDLLIEKSAKLLCEAAGIMSYLDTHTLSISKDDTDVFVEAGLLAELDAYSRILRESVVQLSERLPKCQTYDKNVWDDIAKVTCKPFNKGAKLVERLAAEESK